MKRKVSNIVLNGLTQKQLDYLLNQYEVGCYDDEETEDQTYWAEIMESFTTDQLNELFDTLEKL